MTVLHSNAERCERKPQQQPQSQSNEVETAASEDETPAVAVAAAVDADDLISRYEAAAFAHLPAATLSNLRQRKRWSEEIAVCELLLRQWHEAHGMEPTECAEKVVDERRRTVLCYAMALEGLGRRRDAIDALRLCLGVGKEEFPEADNGDNSDGNERILYFKDLDVQVTLALAKLYFKDERKKIAMKWLGFLLGQLRRDSANGNTFRSCSPEDASDVYHLAGWVKIHADDHTGAYELWTEGHELVLGCESLGRQHRKRACWDDDEEGNVDAGAQQCDPALFGLIGQGAHGDGRFSLDDDLEGFVVPPALRTSTPALALFDPSTQRDALVFRSRRALLTSEECANVLRIVDDFHTERRDGKWGTVRHSSVTTTDVAVEDIPELRPWLRELLRTRLYPMVDVCYPRLADGSSTLEGGEGIEGDSGRNCRSRVRVHDAFIVRYDAERDGSYSLPEHSDTSAISFTVALNSGNTEEAGGDFEGGGTWFESLGEGDGQGLVVDAEVGRAVAFAGPLRHAGYPVSRGTRVILVLFLYVEGFSYGKYLQQYRDAHGAKCFLRASCDREEADVDGGEEKKDTTHWHVDGSDGRASTTCAGGRKPSGDIPGGFVVYNQTIELVELLNRKVDSVLD